MKQFLIISVAFLFFQQVIAQKSDLPNLTIKDLNNKNVNSQSLEKEPLLILNFWATWCSNCIYELDELSYEFPDWQKETNVILVAISVDDYRTISRVKPFLKSHLWPYTILLDTNQKLKRAFNINAIPYTIILKKGIIIYKKAGYSPTNLSDMHSILIKSSN
jgi:peroxiredoxin